MTNFENLFKQCTTLEELKKLYRKLAMQYHPDKGGSNEEMQAINNLYEKHFERCKRNSQKQKTYNSNQSGNTETENTTDETASDYIDLINELMPLDGLNIDVCGSWLWITGKTYFHKDKLKELGFRYSKNKKAWYKDMNGFSKRRKKGHLTMSQIYEKYGRQTYTSKAFAALPQ